MLRAFRAVAMGAVAGLAGMSVLFAAPSMSCAEQFVLFDVTFTFTKEDADNSKPSKSHYYVRDKQLNPDRPKDWTAPVDYRNGTVHIRTEVIEKPAGSEPTTWSLCYIPNKGQKNGYGCTGTVVYRENGVYEQDVSMKSFWQNDSIVWSEGIKQMDLVIKDSSGGSGHAHKRPDSEKFFPTRMRITMVQVSAGSKYDPSLVPNLPAKKDETGEKPKDGAVEPITLKLWPEGPQTAMAPKSHATAKLIQSYGGVGPHRITDVSDPTITVYRPENPNGTSVIVAPGGGFMFLSYTHEGTQVCDWLNSLGVTAVLLKYRTPTRDEKEMFELPVQDAERALGLVRHHAAEWKLDPKRVGLLGFSAGANLAGHVSWDRGSRTYPQKPELDDPRGPDFLVFIYGGGFLDKDDKSKFRSGFSIPADAPPVFMLVAHDDASNPIESAMLYLEYKKRGLSAELHICAKGGHGFGMRKDGKPINDWPQRCAEWMNSLGFLDAN